MMLPTWAIYVIGFGSPAAAFLGAMFGHVVVRKAATELETRSRREQMMQTLQWAAELAVCNDQGRATLGLEQLKAVDESDLTDTDVQTFVSAALEAVVAQRAAELRSAGEDSEAIQPPTGDDDVGSGGA